MVKARANRTLDGYTNGPVISCFRVGKLSVVVKLNIASKHCCLVYNFLSLKPCSRSPSFWCPLSWLSLTWRPRASLQDPHRVVPQQGR